MTTTLRATLVERLRRQVDAERHPMGAQLLQLGGLMSELTKAGFASIDAYEMIWEFMRRGVLVAGNSQMIRAGQNSQWELPFLAITPYGERYLTAHGDDPDPYDAIVLLDSVRARVGSLSEVVTAYLREASISFAAGAYLGANVLAGVAAEAMAEELYCALAEHLDAESCVKFEMQLERSAMSAAGRWDIFRKVMRDHSDCLGDVLSRQLDNRVDPLLRMMKANRDDAAHRRVTPVNEDAARAALVSFIPFAAAVHNLAEALRLEAHPGSRARATP